MSSTAMPKSGVRSTGVSKTVTARPALLALIPLLAAVSILDAQRKNKLPPRWKIDPYTKNDPERMRKAGYVSFGPFEFGELGSKNITSEHVEDHLFYARIIWVETAHFRIGSTLTPWSRLTSRLFRSTLAVG